MLHKHKKHHEGGVNTNGWMMSYADMATTLLAMFIALSTLGKDQSGVSFYNGTGSFLRALDTFGLPNLFPSSTRAIQLQATGPHYWVGDPGETEGAGSGHSGESGAETSRVIDIEEEEVQHFLGEMKRQFQVEKLPRARGQAVVDFYERLNKKSPYLPAKYMEVIGQVVPLLRRSHCQVSVVVWATTPSDSAWIRAVNEARAVVEEVAAVARLDATERARLAPLGQPWRYANIRRPILSLIITQTEPPA